MKEKRRLLIAVDGSEQSFEAVRYVSQLFSPARMEVVLFHLMSKIPESFWDIQKHPALRHKLGPVAAWAAHQQSAIEEFMQKSRQLFLDEGVPEEAVRSYSSPRKWRFGWLSNHISGALAILKEELQEQFTWL
ncbi:MAG: universal stress protein [Syntrophobacterales bacterium]|jgi:hypothetical protein